MSDINNEPLINTIFDILYGADKSPDNLIIELITTVAEDLHEIIIKLTEKNSGKVYINRTCFTDDINEAFRTKYGSQYKVEGNESDLAEKQS